MLSEGKKKTHTELNENIERETVASPTHQHKRSAHEKRKQNGWYVRVDIKVRNNNKSNNAELAENKGLENLCFTYIETCGGQWKSKIHPQHIIPTFFHLRFSSFPFSTHPFHHSTYYIHIRTNSSTPASKRESGKGHKRKYINEA